MITWSAASAAVNLPEEPARMFQNSQIYASGWIPNCIEISMEFSSVQKQELAKGLAVMIGVAVFGLNGPFLFVRFGLNVPEAAAAGCVAGAAITYALAERFLRSRYGHSQVPALPGPDAHAGLDDLRAGGASGTVEASPTKARIERELARACDQEAARIRVEVRRNKVILKGTVPSWADEAEAERIAFDTPGIEEVDNRLEVVH